MCIRSCFACFYVRLVVVGMVSRRRRSRRLSDWRRPFLSFFFVRATVSATPGSSRMAAARDRPLVPSRSRLREAGALGWRGWLEDHTSNRSLPRSRAPLPPHAVHHTHRTAPHRLPTQPPSSSVCIHSQLHPSRTVLPSSIPPSPWLSPQPSSSSHWRSASV